MTQNSSNSLEPNPDPLLNVEITRELIEQHGILPEEYEQILDILGANPTYGIGIFSVMWSEHCAYKNTRKFLRLFPTEKQDRDAIGQVLVKAGEENAGVIDVGDGWGVAFKIESHNHPVRSSLLKVRLPVWEESCVIFSQWVLDRFF